MKKPLLFLALSLSSPTASNGFAGIDTAHHSTFSSRRARLTTSTITRTKDDISLGPCQQQSCQAPGPVIGTYRYGKSTFKLFSSTEDDEATSSINKRYVHIHVDEETASNLLDPDGKRKRTKAEGSVGKSEIDLLDPDGDDDEPKAAGSAEKSETNDTEKKGLTTLVEEIKSFTQVPSTSVHVHFHPTPSPSPIGSDRRPRKPKEGTGSVGKSGPPVADSSSTNNSNKLTSGNIDEMHASILESLEIDPSTANATNVHVHFDLASLQSTNFNDTKVASINDITVPQDVVTGEDDDELYKDFKNFTDLDDLPADIKLTGGKKLREQGLKGKGIKVGVIDTGIDRDHRGFNGTVLEQKESWFRHGTPLEDDDHGTHVAGTIHMMAPEAEIVDYRVFGKYGSWSAVDAVATAIFQACFDGCHIINMSVGGRWPDEGIRNAVQYAASQNVIIVCSAGNNGDGNSKTIERNFPACWPEAINIAAIPEDFMNVAKFSNSNPEIDYAGIGVGVKSFAPLGGKNETSAMMRSKDGTSMACPHVAGLIAALMTDTTENDNGDKQNVSYSDLIKDDASLRTLLNDRFAINLFSDTEVKETGFDHATGFGFLTFLNRKELDELVKKSPACSSSLGGYKGIGPQQTSAVGSGNTAYAIGESKSPTLLSFPADLTRES